MPNQWISLPCNINVLIKQCFQRKTISPQPYLVKYDSNPLIMCTMIKYDWDSSLTSGDSIRKHNFGLNLTFQGAGMTLKTRSRSLKSNLLFPFSQQCIYAKLVKTSPLNSSEDRIMKVLIFNTVFMVVTLKIRSRLPKSNPLFIVSH